MFVEVESRTGKRITVPHSIYNSHFKKLGYHEVAKKAASHMPLGAPVEESPSAMADESKEASLPEKPVSEWSKEEVKQFVSDRNIDTSSAKNLGDVRRIIAEYLESEG